MIILDYTPTVKHFFDFFAIFLVFRASASIKFWAGALVLSSADHGHAAALICSYSFSTTTFFVTAFWKKEGHKSSFVIFKIVWIHLLCPKNAAAFHGQPAAKAMVPSHSSWPGAITIIFSNLFSLKPFGFQRIEPQTKSTAVFRYICITTAVLLAGVEGFEPSARGFGDRCSTN